MKISNSIIFLYAAVVEWLIVKVCVICSISYIYIIVFTLLVLLFFLMFYKTLQISDDSLKINGFVFKRTLNVIPMHNISRIVFKKPQTKAMSFIIEIYTKNEKFVFSHFYISDKKAFDFLSLFHNKEISVEVYGTEHNSIEDLR